MYQTNLESNNFLRLSYKERRFRKSESYQPLRHERREVIARKRAIRKARRDR